MLWNAQKNIYSTILLTKNQLLNILILRHTVFVFYLRDKIFRYTFWSWIEFQFLDFILDALIHRSNMSVIFLITRQIYFGVSDWIGRKITCKLFYSSQYPKPKRNYTKQWTNFYSRLLKLDKIIRSLTRNVLAVKLSLRATH